jgi:hypothetical protein
MKWLVADSLYCPEAFFASHLDSYSHYLREYGETVDALSLNFLLDLPGNTPLSYAGEVDVLFALDRYREMAQITAAKRIAQVAAICNPMPWDVRKPDGSPAYDLIVSSIPWMVDEARAKGCRAEYMPLAFDTRARVCGMGVERDLGCIFIGTQGGNHVRRTQLLAELADVVTVMPPVFGREYFKTLARAKVVLNVHAEWARGAANNMRMFEAAGMGALVVSDGEEPTDMSFYWKARDADEMREGIDSYETDRALAGQLIVLAEHTYERRIPRLVELARSL